MFIKEQTYQLILLISVLIILEWWPVLVIASTFYLIDLGWKHLPH